ETQATRIIAALDALVLHPAVKLPLTPAVPEPDAPAPADASGSSAWPRSVARAGSPKESPRQPRAVPSEVPIQCPDCGAEGSVRWDRLGHILQCKGCAGHYRVRADGQVVPVNRNAAGKWAEAKRRPAIGGRLRL